MKTYVFAAIGLVALIATIGLVTASHGSGNGSCDQQSFVDEDGDGVCDNWVDADGDGVNDNCLMDGVGNQYCHSAQQGNCYGTGDGIEQRGFGPREGMGFGSGQGKCHE